MCKSVKDDHSSCTSILITPILGWVIFHWLGRNSALSGKTAQMLPNKRFSLCIVGTSWNIYANLTCTKGERSLLCYEADNRTTFGWGVCVFTSVFYGCVCNSWGFYLGGHKGVADFHLLFSVLLSFLPADFTFYDANGWAVGFRFSLLSAGQ